MTTETHIINYLASESKGVINCSHAQARALIDIVLTTTGPQPTGAIARLYRYNAVSSQYDFIYTRQCTNEQIKEAILTALETSPAHGFYMWECYNSAGEFEGKIYTINTQLF